MVPRLLLADQPDRGDDGADQGHHQPGDGRHQHPRCRQIGVEEHLGAQQPTAVAGRDLHRLGHEQRRSVDVGGHRHGVGVDHHVHLIGAQQLDRISAADVLGDVEQVGKPVRDGAGIVADDRGGDVLDAEVRRVAEDHQQDHRKQDNHRECPAISSQLTELFDDHGAHIASLILARG